MASLVRGKPLEQLRKLRIAFGPHAYGQLRIVRGASCSMNWAMAKSSSSERTACGGGVLSRLRKGMSLVLFEGAGNHRRGHGFTNVRRVTSERQGGPTSRLPMGGAWHSSPEARGKPCEKLRKHSDPAGSRCLIRGCRIALGNKIARIGLCDENSRTAA